MKKLFAALLLPVTVGMASPVIAQGDGENVTGKPPAAGQVDSNKPPGTDRMNERERPMMRDQTTGSQSDRDVAAAVRRAIENDQTLSSSARNGAVSAQGGIVVLSGRVQTNEERSRLVSLAQQAPNVRNVENRIVVQNP